MFEHQFQAMFSRNRYSVARRTTDRRFYSGLVMEESCFGDKHSKRRQAEVAPVKNCGLDLALLPGLQVYIQAD
jgi:hypothetical protein